MKHLLQVQLGNNKPVFHANNFKRVCELYGLPYHYLKRFKLPITYKEMTITKIEVK
jgi:hypothetical protein